MARKRKSVEQHKRDGTYEPHRHDRRNPPLPDPVDELPPSPKWLSDGAKVVFEEAVELLMGVGLLTRLDTRIVARYSAMVDMIETDFTKATPAMHGQLRGLTNDIGMSAASRERLTVKKPDKSVNEFDEI